MHFLFPLICLCLSGSGCENKQPAHYGLWTFSTFHKSDLLVRIVNYINLVCIILLISKTFMLILASQLRGDFWHPFFKQFLPSFIAHWQNCEKRLLVLSYPSVCLSVRPSVRPHETTQLLLNGFFMKFDIWVFFRKYVEKMKVSLKSDKNEELCKFMTVSRWNLLRKRKFSDQSWNTRLGFNNFFPPKILEK